MKKKIAYGFENALNDSRDDFHEDGHATTIRLLARHALFILMRVGCNAPDIPIVRLNRESVDSSQPGDRPKRRTHS